MQIRSAHPEEYRKIGEMTVRAYRAGTSDPYRPQLLDVAARAVGCSVLVAVDEEVLGTVTYVPGPGTPQSEFTDGDASGMRMLAVDPAARRRGIGKALVEACIDRARADLRRRLVIHVRPEMAAARRIYDVLGFRPDPLRDFEPLPGVPLLGYVLELDEIAG